MHTRDIRNRTVTKFAAFVHVVCDTVCIKFCSKRITFDKVIVKKLKISMGLGSRFLKTGPGVLTRLSKDQRRSESFIVRQLVFCAESETFYCLKIS